MNLTNWEKGQLMYLVLKVGGFISEEEDKSTDLLGKSYSIGFKNLLSAKPSESQDGKNLVIRVLGFLGFSLSSESKDEIKEAVEAFKQSID